MLRLMRARYWSHALVGVMVVLAASNRSGPGPQLGLHAVHMAVLAGCAWALHLSDDIGKVIAGGFHAQHRTWNRHVRPSRDLDDADEAYTALVQRMRQTETYVRAVARNHQLDRLTISILEDCYGPDAAACLRQGRQAHLGLGSSWLLPGDTSHLPVVIEHELAHILRHDRRRSTAAQTIVVMLTILAAAWLPLSGAALAGLGIWLLYIGCDWRRELACDTRAIRACGRQAVIRLWTRDIEMHRAQPLPKRLHRSLRSARTHPPTALRIWWARRVAAPDPVPHPLSWA